MSCFKMGGPGCCSEEPVDPCPGETELWVQIVGGNGCCPLAFPIDVDVTGPDGYAESWMFNDLGEIKVFEVPGTGGEYTVTGTSAETGQVVSQAVEPTPCEETSVVLDFGPQMDIPATVDLTFGPLSLTLSYTGMNPTFDTPQYEGGTIWPNSMVRDPIPGNPFCFPPTGTHAGLYFIYTCGLLTIHADAWICTNQLVNTTELRFKTSDPSTSSFLHEGVSDENHTCMPIHAAGTVIPIEPSPAFPIYCDYENAIEMALSGCWLIFFEGFFSDMPWEVIG